MHDELPSVLESHLAPLVHGLAAIVVELGKANHHASVRDALHVIDAARVSDHTVPNVLEQIEWTRTKLAELR